MVIIKREGKLQKNAGGNAVLVLFSLKPNHKVMRATRTHEMYEMYTNHIYPLAIEGPFQRLLMGLLWNLRRNEKFYLCRSK